MVPAAEGRRWRCEEVISVARLGESLSSVLDGLEELGLEGVPASMEYDLRRAMNLHSPTPPSSASAPTAHGVSVAAAEACSSCSTGSPTPEQQQQHLDLLPSEEELVEELFRSAADGGGDLAPLVRVTNASPSPLSDRFQEL